MDVDWCLTCNCAIVRSLCIPTLFLLTVFQDGSWPYCSSACQTKANLAKSLADKLPSRSDILFNVHVLSASESYSGDDDDDDDDELIYHDIREVPPTGLAVDSSSSWTLDSIEAWRVNVPPLDSSSIIHRSFRPPKLLNQQRPVPPTLCMSKPQPSAEPSRQNLHTPSQPTSILSTISSKLRRLRAQPRPTPIMLSPSSSTDSLSEPSTCSSPINEKIPVHPWWSNSREVEPVSVSPSSQSIRIKSKRQPERPPPQTSSLRRASPLPPPPLIQMRQDHPALRGRRLYTRPITA